MSALPAAAGQDEVVSPADVIAAADLIRGQIIRTPTLPAPKLSQLTGAEVVVKYENLQATGSFKDRGALVRLLSLGEEERRRGVVTVSAGNHAQALAWHAKRLGIAATIIMPTTTPYIKVGNTEMLGGRVVLHGETVSEAEEMAMTLSRQGLTLVHPYDDAQVIAGQGTAGLECFEDAPDLECLILPIGGGGLASGVALAAMARRPGIELIGVQSAHYPSAYGAFKGAPVACGGQTLAEGIAVKRPGRLTLPIIKQHFADIMLVDEALIERAVFAFMALQKTVAEGAGAAPLAAMLADPQRFCGRRVGLIMSGGNVDPRILASIAYRGLEAESKIISLRLVVPDTPGILGRVATSLGSAGANILDVSHRRLFLDVPAKGTTLDLTIETKGTDHAAEIVAKLAGEGYEVIRLDGPGGRELPEK